MYGGFSDKQLSAVAENDTMRAVKVNKTVKLQAVQLNNELKLIMLCKAKGNLCRSVTMSDPFHIITLFSDLIVCYNENIEYSCSVVFCVSMICVSIQPFIPQTLRIKVKILVAIAELNDCCQFDDKAILLYCHDYVGTASVPE